MCVKDVYLGKVGGIGEVEVGSADGFGRLVVEVGNLVDVKAELAGLGGVEGVETVGVHLGGVESRADAAAIVSVHRSLLIQMLGGDLLIEGDHDSSSFCVIARSQCDCLEEVQ